MLNFDRSAVKSWYIQNDCHQCLSDSYKVRQIHFRPGLFPRSLAGLRGSTYKGEGKGRGAERERGEERRERWENGRDRPLLTQIPWFAPVHPARRIWCASHVVGLDHSLNICNYVAYSYGDCLEVKREYYQNCFILATCYLFNGHS